MKQKIMWAALLLSLPTLHLQAKMDLVTVPKQDSVQITIYNSSDLTLVRETRLLTLTKGINNLQFSWSNTLIDPTSLSMRPLQHGDEIDVESLVFPPRTKSLGLWKVNSEIAGQVSFEITYFTSGINWRAFYIGTLSKDETSMQLQGYVKVANNSGEEYKNAQTRLIVGKINLIDQIAILARRPFPYNSPLMPYEMREESFNDSMPLLEKKKGFSLTSFDASRKREVLKESLSEYFLYTIEGKETIPNRWSKRLPSFNTNEIPVVNLYKFEQRRYGNQCIRFISFKNDKAHQLGDTPIPEGNVQLFRNISDQQNLTYEGASRVKYIPVGEKTEMNLGAVSNVKIKPTLIKKQMQNIKFDHRGNINGYDEVQNYKLTITNSRKVKTKVEITRQLSSNYWELSQDLTPAEFRKMDARSVRFTIELDPNSTKEIFYSVRYYNGIRRELTQNKQGESL